MSTRRQILTAILFSAAAWAQGPAAPPHNKSLLASEFPGADCGAKINAALTALAGPGEVLVPATRTRCPRGTTSCTTVPWIPRRPKAFCCTRIETRRPGVFRRFLGRQPAVWRLVFFELPSVRLSSINYGCRRDRIRPRYDGTGVRTRCAKQNFDHECLKVSDSGLASHCLRAWAVLSLSESCTPLIGH